MNLTNGDKSIIRDLAKRQRDYSQLPLMEKRKREWTEHNDLKGIRPMIHVETATFESEILPPLRCGTETGRRIESTILRGIANHELIGDDRVVQDFFPINWDLEFTPFNLKVNKLKPREGGVGHQFDHPIRNFPEDFLRLGESIYSVDREATFKFKEIAEDALGDILPVKLVSSSEGFSPTQLVVHLMGMEDMIFAMMDYPDEFHQMMNRITEDHISFFKWKEKEGLYRLNNGNDHLGQGSFGFTDDLPVKDLAGLAPGTEDLWIMMESQETVSVSPQMYGEFVFPYYERIASLFGLVSYGCCEPVHEIWEPFLSRCANIRKVSVSPWCDEEFMGDALKGGTTIYHRKPSPNYMGVDKSFDEEGFRAHILKTLKAARGCKLEFSFRDVYTLCGDSERPRKMVEILRNMIEDHWEM